MKKYGVRGVFMCACCISILAEDTLQRQIQGKLDKEYNSQKQKDVIRVDKVLQNHALQDMWIRDRGKESVRNDIRRNDKPTIKWFQKNMNLHFPTSNHLHHPFHIRRSPLPTVGMPWPKPQTFHTSPETLFIIKRLSVRKNLTKCDVLIKAVNRYKDIIFTCHNLDFVNNLLNVKNADFKFTDPRVNFENIQSPPELSRLYLDVALCPYYPSLSSDESYTMKMSTRGILIRAPEVWGAIRALETLSQLVICINNTFIIRKTEVIDFPRFRHRGILIDSARHFMSKETIFQMLRAMEMNKMNVLHWHLSDDQSFPYKSETFPDLSSKGAYHPHLTYTAEDVKDIIEFARIRGIRIIPEFDTPGHTYAWGLGYPDLLTQCYDSQGPIPGHFGPMNPARNNTYRFLSMFFKEILEVFKDQFVHLGNDEVPLACWKTNPEVIRFMSQINHISNFKNEGTAAWSFFTERLIQTIKNVSSEKENGGARFVLWQEAFQSNLNIPRDAIIQVWLGPQTLVEDVTLRGYQAIVSTCWYINMIQYGVVWPEYYLCDPISSSFRGRKELVLGGEACLWSEYITSETAIGLLWPKAAAVGERLWSDQSLRDIDEAAPRLEEHRCRMLRRGLSVGDISGPGFCFTELNKHPIQPTHTSRSRQYPSSVIKNNQGAYRFSAGFLLVGMCVFAFFVFRIRKIRMGCFVTRLTR